MLFRSSGFSILLVAWRMKAVGIYSASIPVPLSLISISFTPPDSMLTVTCVAPASMELFQKLLNHRCGALYHLTGGDQLRSMLIQNMDDCHGLFPPL